LQIGKNDIDPKVREVWKMRFRPIDEVIRDINIQEARDEGREEAEKKKAFEIAGNFLADGLSPDIIARNTGLSLEDVQSMSR
jgi:predicted transposase/invertase (TIGR01784 family)